MLDKTVLGRLGRPQEAFNIDSWDRTIVRPTGLGQHTGFGLGSVGEANAVAVRTVREDQSVRPGVG
jgi:hypothetical protein